MNRRESHWRRGERLSIGAAVCLLVGSSPTGGAIAEDAGSLLREQQRRDELQRLERLPPPADARPSASPLAGAQRGETILVRELRFTGKTEILSQSERARIAATARNKRLGLAGLKALADEATMAIQAGGRVLGYAILPPQDITEGVITVEIHEGALEGIGFRRAAGVRASEYLLQRIIASRIRAEGVEKGDLEEALLRANDWPGVVARAKLTAGAAPHSSRLVVDVEQAPLLSASLSSDNYGWNGTGRIQKAASVAITDLTSLGDFTRLSGTFSDGQKFAQAAFSAPLYVTGLSLNANYGYLYYRNLDHRVSSLELEGYAHYAGLGLDYGLIRSRDFNLHLSGGANWKALTDESSAGRLQDKRSISGALTLSGDMRDQFFGDGALTSWSLAWTFGDIDLSRVQSALEVDQAGLRTQGKFHRLNLSVARLEKLPGDFSLFARFYGQWANRNLDSSEDFALGGPYGVRGYPVGEARGDMGLLGTLELRYDLPAPSEWGQAQLAALLDGGRVWGNRFQNGVSTINECRCNDFSLAGAGVSVRWTWEKLSFSAVWAHALGDNPDRSNQTGANADGRTRSQQFWLQGAVRF